MTRDVLRADLYRARINLWVEDRLTREYLSAIWESDPDVGFLVAGGNDGVAAVVKDAESDGIVNVFGVVDGDTRPTNRPDWTNPAKTFRTFVLPVHEIENYLLDADSLEKVRLNTLGKTAEAIARLLQEEAARQCWSTAARGVVAELRRRFREDFLTNPPRGLADRDSALRRIIDADWFRDLAGRAARSTASDIAELLDGNYRQARAEIDGGTWRRTFAGKEIFRHIGSLLHVRRTDGGRFPSKAEFDIDLAKELAAEQVRSGRVPPDLLQLRTALNDRVARATQAAT